MAAIDTASQQGLRPDLTDQAARVFAWWVTATTFAFLGNAILTFWFDWPGPSLDGDPQGMAQAAIYPLALLQAVLIVRRQPGIGLRGDAERLSRISAYIVRAAFWAVFLTGLTDAIISFLRVEDLLTGLIGEALAQDLGRNQFRGPYVHAPLILASLVIAAFTRGIGVVWLTLLVVLAELQIVLLRFIFSYEQAFMADLVRFWYAALFLFASAYTLTQDGHVRVDVFYASMSRRRQGLVNAFGSVFMGMTLCAVILLLGMGSQASTITSPILALEVTQSGFGMYVKYMMAGFLGVFAVTMMIQFASYFLLGVADMRDPVDEAPVTES